MTVHSVQKCCAYFLHSNFLTPRCESRFLHVLISSVFDCLIDRPLPSSKEIVVSSLHNLTWWWMVLLQRHQKLLTCQLFTNPKSTKSDCSWRWVRKWKMFWFLRMVWFLRWSVWNVLCRSDEGSWFRWWWWSFEHGFLASRITAVLKINKNSFVFTRVYKVYVFHSGHSTSTKCFQANQDKGAYQPGGHPAMLQLESKCWEIFSFLFFFFFFMLRCGVAGSWGMMRGEGP